MMEKEMTTKLNTDEARALVERLTGYTPGPWRVSLTDDTTVICPERTVVAEIDGDYNEPDLWPVMENNAALIAAAPDLHAALTAALDEIERLETQIRSLDHALNFILFDAAWTPKHPACESIIARINALRKGDDQ